MTTPRRPVAPHPAARPFDDTPLRGATSTEAVRRFFERWWTFTGRASRSEYWHVVGLQVAAVWVAFMVVTLLEILGVEAAALALGDVTLVVLVCSVVPMAALNTRRLHDVGLAGWWQLLALLPFGWVGLVVVGLVPGRTRGERFDAARPVVLPCAGCERCRVANPRAFTVAGAAA